MKEENSDMSSENGPAEPQHGNVETIDNQD